MRIFGIAVRIIGGEDEMVTAHFFYRMARRRLIGLDRDKALALEIFTRRHLEIRHEDIALALVAFIQAPEQPR